MQSVYVRDIFTTNTININSIQNKIKSKYLYIPYIGLLHDNEEYKLPKVICNTSKLFYGDNKLLQIDNNTYIQFEGDTKIMSNKWYIKNVLHIIQNYNKIFNTNNITIYIQIIQKKIHNNNSFVGGYASCNAIEMVLYENINICKDKLIIKQFIAHELLHLYFPSIPSKYGMCYNEGLLDYLSIKLNFSNKEFFYLTDHHIKEYYRYKEKLNNIPLLVKRPYLIGYLYGYIMEDKKIDKIINYIKLYIKKRKYMLIPWNNKSYIIFIKKNLFINKLCKNVLSLYLDSL
jgi:hypothetical protein